jgi:hypothetical protein
MRELTVSTQTTPVELARLFNRLAPDDEVGGKPGADGAVILYVCNDGRSPRRPASGRIAISARVAIDVVLQHVDGMPGAQPLVAKVRKQLAEDGGAKAGWLAPPLTMLATLYCKTAGAMSAGASQLLRLSGHARIAVDHDSEEQAQVTPEQRQALEALIDKLMLLPCRSRQLDRTPGLE